MPKIFKYLSSLRKKPNRQEKLRPSTETAKDNSVSYQHGQGSATLSSFTLHKSIKTLTYESFIQIITGEDLGPLIISGEPPIDELVSAWDNISEEYGAAIKTHRSKSVFEAYKKFVRLESQMKLIDASLFYLTHEYDEEIAQILADNGYYHVQPNDNREEYLRQLKIVKTQAGTLVVMLNQAAANYKLLASDSELKAERDYQSFLDELAILSEHQGYALRPKEITVAEYCAVVNNFMAKVEANKKKQK